MFLAAGLAGLAGLIAWPFLRAAGQAGGAGGYLDPRFKRVLWYLIASSRGGANRAKIIDLVNSRPANANQIASELKLDYKTVLHHLKVLTENGLIITEDREAYGATYFLTPLMEKNYQSFQEILARVRRE
ncbi:MAG: winged helix-turn-helix domain-containing protein [Nitrososphaera sp.]|uniref:ArsR/SmtB family transcription factor n=1 Tax=Nitrososphaera sp. TaxID=1971748 RepID=UPI0017A1E221|nr:winged helix-turn-helix domain-containing protein [Nitrososphaera sp.]NWG37913.1 winged helix-turn-helix transcriptional regulator [Nitrososphaera sp.]